jgi:hypothetical protein
MKIEVSNGEILDKISILEIKKARINNEKKLVNIEKELSELLPLYEVLVTSDEVEKKYLELKSVNEQLWDIEDDIREWEDRYYFGDKFVELARLVYITNDRRAKIKKDINLLSGSELIEEKSYKQY